MITVEKLVKRYGSKTAVDGVSFDVAKGEVVGFLGPNGAGKSTTLRILSGFLGMTSGKVSVAGYDIREQSLEARQKIGYMPEAVPLYPEMRVSEYLAFRAELKRVPKKDRANFIGVAMEKANVSDVASTLIGHLSKGYKQRVGLADALVAQPPLLVLDEPTAGLDPNQIREVRDVLRSLGTDHTVLLSTHILSEVEATCSRVVVIAKGKVVAQGTMDELARKRRPSALSFSVRGDRDAIVSAVGAVRGFSQIEVVDTRDGIVALRATWGRKLDDAGVAQATEEAVSALVRGGHFVREVRVIHSSLEELFAELTRDVSATASTEEAPE